MDFVGFSWIFPLIFRHWPSVCHDCLRETITVWASKDSTIYIVDETSPFRLPNLPKIKGNYCLDLLSMVPIDAIHKGILDLQITVPREWLNFSGLAQAASQLLGREIQHPSFPVKEGGGPPLEHWDWIQQVFGRQKWSRYGWKAGFSADFGINHPICLGRDLTQSYVRLACATHTDKRFPWLKISTLQIGLVWHLWFRDFCSSAPHLCIDLCHSHVLGDTFPRFLPTNLASLGFSGTTSVRKTW